MYVAPADAHGVYGIGKGALLKRFSRIAGWAGRAKGRDGNLLRAEGQPA
jgi:hypothetical protein